MATLNVFWPPSGGGSSSNASVGSNGVTAPTSSTEVAGVNPSGNLQPLQTTTDGALIVAQDPTVEQHVIVDSSALPSGASTSSLQTTGNSSLATIATNTTGVATAANQATQITAEQAIQASTATIATNSATQATAANQISTQGTVGAGTAATKSELIGVVYNSSLPTLTTGQQAAAQADSSGRLIISPSTTLNTSDAANGPVTPGTVATKSELNGYQYNTTLPTVATGQQVAAQCDSSGRALVSSIANQTVKAASTAAVAADPALVVALSPNNNTLANALFVKNTDGTNTGAVKAASTAAVATDPALVVALSPNNNTLANALFEKITDGTNTAAVKAASTAAATTDPSLVVQLSPNSNVPLQPGKGTLTDASTTTSATPSTSTTIFATNAARKYMFIQNLSNSATIYINFTSAATAGAGSIAILPYGSYVQEASYVSTEAVTVLSTTASVPFTAKQG